MKGHNEKMDSTIMQGFQIKEDSVQKKRNSNKESNIGPNNKTHK